MINFLLNNIKPRSNCCSAKIITWHSDKFYCEKCEAWLYQSTLNEIITKPYFAKMKLFYRGLKKA